MKPQVSAVDSDLVENVLEISGPACGGQEGEGRSWNGGSSIFRERETRRGSQVTGKKQQTRGLGPDSGMGLLPAASPPPGPFPLSTSAFLEPRGPSLLEPRGPSLLLSLSHVSWAVLTSLRAWWMLGGLLSKLDTGLPPSTPHPSPHSGGPTELTPSHRAGPALSDPSPPPPPARHRAHQRAGLPNG